jgi:hypothetical protein
MTKKAVFIIFTFTIFFYVIFAPDDYDGGGGISTQHVEQIIKTKEDTSFTNAAREEGNKDSMNNSYVNLSSNKPQSEPLKLKLPTELTPDPDDNSNADMREEGEGEREDNSNDYDGDSSHLRENEEEEEDALDEYKDEDEQSKDFDHRGTDDDDNEKDEEKQNEQGEGLSPAEKVYGAVEEDEAAEIESSEQSFKDSETPARGNYSVEEEEIESQYRGSLRGSNTADKNPFGRDHVMAEDTKETETVGNAKYKEEDEEEEEEEVLESSGDVDEEDKTFYKKQSPLEIPNSSVIIEDDESTKVKDENTTLNSAKIEKEDDGDGDDSSEGLSAKEKAAFNAKYGSGTKSMEDELNEQEDANDMGNSMLNNQPPLEIPNADADTTSKQETMQKKMSSGLTMEEDVNKQLKFMADDVDKGEKDESVKDEFKSSEYGDLETSDQLNAKKEFDDNEDHSNTKGKLMSDVIDADEEEESKKYAASDETLKVTEVIPKQKSDDAIGDSKEERLVSSVEEKFKEYLITNSEDEPEKKNLVDEDKGNTTKLGVDEEESKFDESEEADSKAETMDADAELVEKSEGDINTPELTTSKKVTDEMRKVEGTKYASHEVEKDIAGENASTLGDGSTSEVGENKNSEVIEEEEDLKVEKTLLITDATAEKAENTTDVVEKDVEDKGALSSHEEGRESEELVAEGENSGDGKTIEKSRQSEHVHLTSDKNVGVAIGESANAQQQHDKEIERNEVDAGEESQVDAEKSVVDEREEVVKQGKTATESGESVDDNEDESITYAKVTNESNEPDENQENEEAIKLAEDEAETEESLVDKEMKNEVPIQGDLGEAIKESDGEKEEGGGDTTALSSKLDIEDAQLEAEEPASENENDTEGNEQTRVDAATASERHD